jgi:hypothetical protein
VCLGPPTWRFEVLLYTGSFSIDVSWRCCCAACSSPAARPSDRIARPGIPARTAFRIMRKIGVVCTTDYIVRTPAMPSRRLHLGKGETQKFRSVEKSERRTSDFAIRILDCNQDPNGYLLQRYPREWYKKSQQNGSSVCTNKSLRVRTAWCLLSVMSVKKNSLGQFESMSIRTFLERLADVNESQRFHPN